MDRFASASWRVKKNGASAAILRADGSVVTELPLHGNSGAQIAEAYTIAAAPQLLELCTRIKSVLENNLLVTSDGFRIDCSDLRESLLTAVLRAKGCRKDPGEP
jgi:hypothetical protein